MRPQAEGEAVDEAKLEERLVQLEQALARSLELLASGHTDEARELLSALAARGGQVDAPPVAPAEVISDDELEMAFADAQPEIDQMRHADDVAQQAILQADLALEAEGQMAPHEVGNNFATETMAELLERQGDVSGAGSIRAALEVHGSGPGSRTSRSEVIVTLERWLVNLHGGARV